MTNQRSSRQSSLLLIQTITSFIRTLGTYGLFVVETERYSLDKHNTRRKVPLVMIKKELRNLRNVIRQRFTGGQDTFFNLTQSHSLTNHTVNTEKLECVFVKFSDQSVCQEFKILIGIHTLGKDRIKVLDSVPVT